MGVAATLPELSEWTLTFFNFSKNTTKRPSETAKLHQENGRQYGYRHKHINIFKAG